MPEGENSTEVVSLFTRSPSSAFTAEKRERVCTGRFRTKRDGYCGPIYTVSSLKDPPYPIAPRSTGDAKPWDTCPTKQSQPPWTRQVCGLRGTRGAYAKYRGSESPTKGHHKVYQGRQQPAPVHVRVHVSRTCTGAARHRREEACPFPTRCSQCVPGAWQEGLPLLELEVPDMQSAEEGSFIDLSGPSNP